MNEIRTVKHPLKASSQPTENIGFCKRATDTQSVGKGCEKKNFRNLEKGIDKKTSIWYICRYEERNHEG